jgi:hypothetical protein
MVPLIARAGRALLAGLLVAAAAVAHAQATSEAALKAAFLYKFPGYIEWPATAFASAESPFFVGFLGADDVAAEMEKLVAGRSVSGRRVSVRRLREGDALRGVHLLYIGRGDAAARAQMRAAYGQAGVLVVGDGDRALESGATIAFVPADDRIAFEVSLDNAEHSGLRISSRMLAVARRVVPKS